MAKKDNSKKTIAKVVKKHIKLGKKAVGKARDGKFAAELTPKVKPKKDKK